MAFLVKMEQKYKCFFIEKNEKGSDLCLDSCRDLARLAVGLIGSTRIPRILFFFLSQKKGFLFLCLVKTTVLSHKADALRHSGPS